jgi:3-hydroxyisobutyrate dehydrogenase
MNSNKPITHVALCGLGIMGSGMAARLLDSGVALTVFNRNPDRAAPLAAKGAKLAGTPREAAAGAEFVISMVADDAASRAVWMGVDGALSGVKAGTVLIESSTLTPGWVRELAAEASKRRCELLDAPVTGSKTQSAAGELNFLVGGSAEALEKARPVLAMMGRNIHHFGPTGSGALIKLINNFLCGVQVVSLAEAFALIERSGLNRDASLEFLKGGAAGSPLFKTIADRMAGQKFEPNFKLHLLAKDLNYAAAEARNHSLELATVMSAVEVLNKAITAGKGDKDMAAVVEIFRK